MDLQSQDAADSCCLLSHLPISGCRRSPDARQIFCAELIDDSAHGPAGALYPPSAAPPVVFPCPACPASLEVTFDDPQLKVAHFIYICIYLYIFWCACLANNSVQRLCGAKLQFPSSPLLRFPLPFETYCHRLTRSPMWRIVTFTQTCGACSSTVFVPFALHKHFNSAVKAAVWFILCDGSVPAAPLVTSAEVRLGIRHALPLPFP